MSPDRPVQVPPEGVRSITLGEAVDQSLETSHTWVHNWTRVIRMVAALLVGLLVGLALGGLALWFLKSQNDDLRHRLDRAAVTAAQQRAIIAHLSQTNDTNTRFFCIVRTELVLSIQTSANPAAHTPQAQALADQLAGIPLACGP